MWHSPWLKKEAQVPSSKKCFHLLLYSNPKQWSSSFSTPLLKQREAQRIRLWHDNVSELVGSYIKISECPNYSQSIQWIYAKDVLKAMQYAWTQMKYLGAILRQSVIYRNFVPSQSDSMSYKFRNLVTWGWGKAGVSFRGPTRRLDVHLVTALILVL